MKKYWIIFFFLNYAYTFSQSTTLEECQKAARENSSYLKQIKQIERISYLDEKSYNANYLPQFSLEGLASYQSETFSFPIKVPNLSIPEVAKDQYQLFLTINQVIYDGGAIAKGKDIANAVSELNSLSSEAKLYKTKELVNSLYFSILILKENKNKLSLALGTLEANLKQINSLVQNGALLKSASDAIQVEIIKLRQNLDALGKDIESNIEVLEILTGLHDLSSKEFPLPSLSERYSNINRPEVKALEMQAEVQSKNKELIYSSLLPKFFFFAKGGYASPNALNFLEEDFTSFYILGLKMAWNPFDWGTNQRKREIADINRQNIAFDREELLKNINSSTIKEKSEIAKYSKIIDDDMKIIEIQSQIVKEKFSLLKNGAITSAEYVNDFNALLQYEINLETHKILLANSKINLLTKTGNF